MDDSEIRVFLKENIKPLTTSQVIEFAKQEGMPEHLKAIVEDEFRKPGPNSFCNLFRHAAIDTAVRRLQQERGYSFRQACRYVGDIIHLSPEAVASSYRKIRKIIADRDRYYEDRH